MTYVVVCDIVVSLVSMMVFVIVLSYLWGRLLFLRTVRAAVLLYFLIVSYEHQRGGCITQKQGKRQWHLNYYEATYRVLVLLKQYLVDIHDNKVSTLIV